jgi:uncharacterized membrane protein
VQQWEFGDINPSERSAYGVAGDQGWGAVAPSTTNTNDNGFVARLYGWILNLFMFVLFVGTLWSQLPETVKKSVRDFLRPLVKAGIITSEL